MNRCANINRQLHSTFHLCIQDVFIHDYLCIYSLQWTWVWVNFGSWWWTGRPGVLRFMGSQRVRRDWTTELNWYMHIKWVTQRTCSHTDRQNSIYLYSHTHIPGTGEPGGLLSMGSHRVGHNWSELAAAAAETLLLKVRHMQISMEVQEKATQVKLHRGDIFELRLVERYGILSRQNGTYKGTEAQKIVCPFMAGV